MLASRFANDKVRHYGQTNMYLIQDDRNDWPRKNILYVLKFIIMIHENDNYKFLIIHLLHALLIAGSTSLIGFILLISSTYG